MARTVAAAYATEGIRVNTVVPGYTETPLVTSISGQRRRTRGDRVADPAGPAPAVLRTSKGSWSISPAMIPLRHR